MKTKLFIPFIMIVILCLNPIKAYADMGPKPSINLTFSGINETVYYVTLLSETQSTGPYSYSTDKINEDSYMIKEYKKEGLKVWNAFRDYKDSDGYYFLEYFQRITNDNIFKWTYYPPKKFKVLIYFPNTEQYLVSDKYETYAFDSYFNAEISNNTKAITLKRSYNYTLEILCLIARIVGTIILEILIAILFGLRDKKVLRFIIIVNCITQIILNILLNLSNYSGGSLLFLFNYIWLEILVIIIEAILFSSYFKKASTTLIKPIKPYMAILYSISANSFSLIAGIYIAKLLPGIF